MAMRPVVQFESLFNVPDDSQDFRKELFDKISVEEWLASIKSKRDRDIVRMLLEKEVLRVVAKKWKICRERVRQIFKKEVERFRIRVS